MILLVLVALQTKLTLNWAPNFFGCPWKKVLALKKNLRIWTQLTSTTTTTTQHRSPTKAVSAITWRKIEWALVYHGCEHERQLFTLNNNTWINKQKISDKCLCLKCCVKFIVWGSMIHSSFLSNSSIIGCDFLGLQQKTTLWSHITVQKAQGTADTAKTRTGGSMSRRGSSCPRSKRK